MPRSVVIRLIAIFLSTSFCLSCSSLREDEKVRTFDLEEVRALNSPSSISSVDLSLILSQQRAVDRIRGFNENRPNQDGENPETPIKYVLDTQSNHPKVRKWIHYYCQKDRERFQRFLGRGAQYKRMVQEIFTSQGLPPDLYYLGLLESGYSKKAVSRVGAVGIWQFMAPTGRQYGLKINQFVDERIDPVRSTMAAAHYLKELYRQKKSWHLALASYNAGPGRVRRAIRRGDSENYWSLTRRRLLPYDTREYVPQFLAILYISKNLEKFSFTEKKEEGFLNLELIEVPSPLKLKQITRLTGIPLKEIKKNNPHLLRGLTPPGSKNYPLWIKSEYKQIIADNKAKLSKYRIKGLKVRRFISSDRGKPKVHRVRKGQNLSVIARRYGFSVKKLKKINKLKSNRIYAGQKLKLQKTGAVSSPGSFKRKLYRVRQGDSLHRISKKFNLSVKELKKINKLKSNRIYAGQKLKLQKTSRRSLGKKRYRIRRGDSLHKISKKFGLTVKQLKKLNKLKTNKIIYGKYLLVARKDKK